MAKMNYTKIEDSFDEGIRKIDVDRLLEETEKGGEAAKKHLAKQLVLSMRYDLRALDKRGLDPYAKLQIDKKTMKTLVEHVEELTPEEWTVIKEMKKKIDQFKLETKGQGVAVSDEKLVEEERRTQPNKRFNLNDKWWPL